MDEGTVQVLLAAIAAVVSIATAVVAAWGARKADNAAKLSQATDNKAERLTLQVNGRLTELIAEAQGRARAEGVIAGVSSTGDRRAGSISAAMAPPPTFVTPTAPGPTAADPLTVDAIDGTAPPA